jgi:CHAT domain-containing protein
MRVQRTGLIVVASLSLFAAIAAAQQPGPAEELPRDRAIERALAKGERHVYRVGLESGQFIRVLIEPPEAMIEATLTAPDGRLASAYHVELRPESLASVADVAGEYHIAVTATSAAAGPGRYRLRLSELRPSEPLDDHRALAERAVAEGIQSYQKGTPESVKAALDRFAAALPQWQAAGERRQEARTLTLLAQIRNESRDPRAGLTDARAALAIFEEIDVRGGEAEALTEIGNSLVLLEEFPNAAHQLERAITIYRDIGDVPGVANTLNSLANVRQSLGDLPLAIDALLESLRLFRQVGHRAREAGVLNALGAVYINLGQPQAGLDALLQSLAIRKEVGDRRGEAVTLNSIATLDFGLGRISEAQALLNEALPLWRAFGDRTGEAVSLSWRARVHHAGGDRRRAVEDANAAVSLFTAVGHRTGEATTRLFMARLANESGDHEAAQRHADAALDLSRSIGARRYQAFALTELGRTATAAGEWDRAAAHLRDALAINQAMLDPDGEMLTTLALARLERARGRLDTAHAHAQATLALIESQRMRIASGELRASLLAARHEAYEVAIDVLMQWHAREPAGGHDAVALETSERAQARSLLDLLVEAGADIRQGGDPELAAEERRLQERVSGVDANRMQLQGRSGTDKRLAEADREIGQLRLQLRELGGRIRTRNPRYAALTEPRPVSVATLQRDLLDDDTVLLEYSLGEERSVVWAVTTRAITSYVLPARAEIEAAARRVHGLLIVSRARQRRREAERAVDELARILVGPVKHDLAAKRIVIVADGALQFVPFAVLPLDRQPLIRRAEVVHLPSASTLAVLRQELAGRSRAPKSVAIFADPVLSADDPRVHPHTPRIPVRSGPANGAASGPLPAGQPRPASDLTRSSGETGVSRFDRLVFTRREAQAIQALAGTTGALLALDFDANRARALQTDLQQYRIVHFATHGLLNSVHPDLSGLVLSLVDREGRPQDGFLRSHDIYNLRLGADLVVLSACRTALGEEIRGEGLVSLVRGFMYAGAPRVIATLWDVSDDATAELMRRFYAGMIGDGMAPAAALRAAQVWMSQHPRWNAPYYWAGFVLQGEWR